MTNAIIYSKEFIFNELEYFTNLINKELDTDEKRKELLEMMNLTDNVYKFIFEKDSEGSNYKHCFKNNKRISWNEVEHWLRPYVWEFEKENNVYC